MSLTLDIGATGMLAQQLNVDTISNNIANMTTTGYKRQRAEFQDLLYQTKVRPGSTSSDAATTVPSGIQQGLGVRAGSIYRINEQGALQMTSNKFD
ncbi:MAG: flagellar hook-basal body complex protein, partial [Alphaproteobacteria bacterium]|nr:flagellar hook-basal body complex protein [Alphaproteobacteria bacterium]